MPTPPAAQGAPSWSSSSGGATSSASASPSSSWDSDPSSPTGLVPTSSSAPSSSPPSPSGCGGGTSSAPSPSPSSSCAACRHQRRRCPPHCLLRPYFVVADDDEPGKFRNALRMFGVKNLQRMLRAVPPPRRDVCVQTVIYESNLRAADPVRGCCGVIQDLENRLMDTAVELEVLRRRLESYRQMARGSSQSSQPPNNPLPLQQQLMARTSDDGVQTQGPADGVPPATNELAATQPQLSAVEMEPQLSQVQPQLSTMPPP